MRISDWSSDVCSSDLKRTPDPKGFETCDDAVMSGESGCRLYPPEGARALSRTYQRKSMAMPGTPHACPRRFVRFGVRSEERRVGNECVITCISRGSPYH